MYARLRSVIMLWLPSFLLLQLLLLAGPGSTVAAAADKKPKVIRHELGFRVRELLYFRNSESVIATSLPRGQFRISHNAGEEWSEAKDVPDRETAGVIMHPFDNDTAFAIGGRGRHWATADQGKTWHKFALDEPSGGSLSFHAGDAKKVIFNAELCFGPLCVFKSYYTLDGFKTVKKLKDGTPGGCIWARAQPEFKVRDPDRNDNLILCAVIEDRLTISTKHERIILSNDFFKTESEPALDGAKTLQGAFELAGVKGYLVIARRSAGTSQLALHISDDGFQWDQAEFENDHKIGEKAYTILESTGYSIQVHVKSYGTFQEMGTVLSSNSNGTYFRKNIDYVNRSPTGFVDFEKVQGIQGIYLVNTVRNHEKVLSSPLEKKQLESQITFDDGRTFQTLKLLDKDGKETDKKVHLHSVTHMSNSGRVYTSPAPGLVMGIGNEGDYLEDYKQGHLYVSDDAGVTWRRARDESHKYEFGDQGSVLMAISDKDTANKAIYSLTHGREWLEFDLEGPLSADLLTTMPDSTSLKFILTGLEGTGRGPKTPLYFVDFEGLHERECGSKDFEDWVARKDKDGKPDCIMGHTQTYRRRKADVDCFINHEFKQPEMKEENCPCTKEDFECDYNFMPEGNGECKVTEVLKPPKGACERGDGDEKFKQAPFRLIPGDTCKKSDVRLDEEQREFECKHSTRPGDPGPPSGEIKAMPTVFDGHEFKQIIYLQRGPTATGTDETVLALVDGTVYVSRDQGKTWEKSDYKEDIIGIMAHPYNKDMVFLLTTSKRVHYSINRGETFHSFEVPAPIPSRGLEGAPLSFHTTEDNWMIWTGFKDGHLNAWYSQTRGEEWHLLAQYIRKCEFIKREGWKGENELVLCEQYEGENPKSSLALVSSSDWFGSTPKEHFRDIVTFATMADYILVAYKDKDGNLKIDASIDGKTFADARFPKDFTVPHSTTYTLLDSSTKSVFLMVTASTRPGFEYGRLMKSNSNGTSYVSLIGAVNQDESGYVDFEKMQGLAGVAMVNVVDNAKEEKATKKLLKTWITHNDGANWQLITNVHDDVDKDFGCRPGNECSLNLHSYTERTDPRDTFASTSGIGLMMATGNVGKHIDGEGDTFITRDGGVEWHRIRKGRFLWEYGDQGSVIVIVKERGPTNMLAYSEDEGKNWKEFKFHDAEITISDLTTIPSDKSRSFIVWGKENRKLVAITVDFDGLRSRTCELKEGEADRGGGDYYHWTPQHPAQDSDCLFGHKTVLHRKRPEADCWNDLKLDPLHSDLTENCTCTRQDFECDYNFELTADNSCKLVKGLEAQDPAQVCKDEPDRVSYFEKQGFRKIPISTCHGGEVGKFFGEEKPCPGKDKEFAEAQPGLRGFGLFLVAFVLPCVAAGTIGWWVYQRWDGKFGRIRLGETSSSGLSNWDADQPWIRYPVAAAAAVVAVVAALPLLLGAAWRQLAGRLAPGARRYTSREHFARSRGEYAVVDPLEDELLGEDDDDF